MTASNPLDLLRPYLWIAAIAFVVGFAMVALLGAGAAHTSSANLRFDASRPATASAPEATRV